MLILLSHGLIPQSLNFKSVIMKYQKAMLIIIIIIILFPVEERSPCQCF